MTTTIDRPKPRALSDRDAMQLIDLAARFTRAGFGEWKLGEIAERVEAALTARDGAR